MCSADSTGFAEVIVDSGQLGFRSIDPWTGPNIPFRPYASSPVHGFHFYSDAPSDPFLGLSVFTGHASHGFIYLSVAFLLRRTGHDDDATAAALADALGDLPA